MRRIVFILLATAVVGILFVAERGREARRETAAVPRLDRGVGGDGERGRIDPHAPAGSDFGSAPLGVAAHLRDRSATGARLDVEVTSEQALNDVRVHAERYDAGAALEAAWSDTLWSGNLAAGATRRLAVEVPFGAASPARIRVVARGTGGAGQRLSVSALVSLGAGRDASR